MYNYFSKYHTETKKLVFSQQYTVKWSEIKFLTRDFVFFGCSDVREQYLQIISELANQRGHKTLFTCVVYASNVR